MAACETCWTEASRRALVYGGFTADRYAEVLGEHWHTPEVVESLVAERESEGPADA